MKGRELIRLMRLFQISCALSETYMVYTHHMFINILVQRRLEAKTNENFSNYKINV